MADNIVDEKHGENKGHRWQPGESGNPNGRPPKGTAITDVMRQMLEEKPEIKRALMSKLLEMAIKGDLAAIREVIDRMDGRAKQSVELSGDEQNPLVVIKHERDKPIRVADEGN